MILVEQIQAARMLIGWTQSDLATASSVAVGTIKRLESKRGPMGGAAATVWKIQVALERAGIEFINSDDGRGPGVRLRNPS
jgi:transcriptional regulator with XRE-family HTH domain